MNRREMEMSPAEFLADVEVAVTDRDAVLPQSAVRVDDHDDVIAAAPRRDSHPLSAWSVRHPKNGGRIGGGGRESNPPDGDRPSQPL